MKILLLCLTLALFVGCKKDSALDVVLTTENLKQTLEAVQKEAEPADARLAKEMYDLYRKRLPGKSFRTHIQEYRAEQEKSRKRIEEARKRNQ